MISPLTIITLSSLAAAALAQETIPMFRHAQVNRSSAVRLDHNRWNEHVSAPAGVAVNPLLNTMFSYMIEVKLGTPGQLATVVVDTGSTSLWVASKKCTVANCGTPKEYFDTSKSSTFKKAPGIFQVQYGSGAVSGTWGKDIISLSPKFSFKGIIGVADKVSGILSKTTDGILGLRPPQAKASGEVPTVVDELHSAGLTKRRVISVYFQPMTKSMHTSANGEMTIGGVDASKVKGAITYFPITKVQPASLYWGFDHTGIAIGSKVLNAKGTGILDTGTTLVILNTEIGNAFFSKIPGHKFDAQTGLQTYPCKGLKNYPTFSIKLGGRKFTLTAEEYTAPAFMMESLGGPKGSSTCESWISVGDTGFDVILGQKFLEYYVSVYDTDKRRMGLGVAKKRGARNAHTKV